MIEIPKTGQNSPTKVACLTTDENQQLTLLEQRINNLSPEETATWIFLKTVQRGYLNRKDAQEYVRLYLNEGSSPRCLELEWISATGDKNNAKRYGLLKSRSMNNPQVMSPVEISELQVLEELRQHEKHQRDIEQGGISMAHVKISSQFPSPHVRQAAEAILRSLPHTDHTQAH